jgi:RNA polymerase sigma-70 factor (ECF subfamily)
MDIDLVSRAQSGDEDAFAELAAAIVDRCYALAYRILRDSDLAHDATQRALLGVWRDLPALSDPGRFTAWLDRSVVHACYSEARRERRSNARVRLAVVRSATTPDLAASVVDRDELERAFRWLTPEQRAVVVLHHYLGYPFVEVAEVLGIPVGTARSRMHYAMRRLREAIIEDARTTTPTERTG